MYRNKCIDLKNNVYWINIFEVCKNQTKKKNSFYWKNGNWNKFKGIQQDRQKILKSRSVENTIEKSIVFVLYMFVIIYICRAYTIQTTHSWNEKKLPAEMLTVNGFQFAPKWKSRQSWEKVPERLPVMEARNGCMQL